MVKCDNCDFPAVVTTDNPAAVPQNFCEVCIPWTLVERFKTGLLPNPNPVIDAVIEEPAKETRKKKVAEEVTTELPFPVEQPEEA
jgi:hypothetical protein